jgi:hypothetical protein
MACRTITGVSLAMLKRWIHRYNCKSWGQSKNSSLPSFM